MKRNRIILAVLVIILQAIPYLLAAFRWQPGWVFGGFLLNPIDGNSYLAKMQEGWGGGWHFTDLYSAQASGGAFLFLFYIGLGHLARLLNVSLIFVFHGARILSGLGLLAALSILCDQVFGSDSQGANLAFGLASLGSGLGWLAALGWGSLSGDFWIAEAYPFLSMYANPHFPLGLALVLGLVSLDLGLERRWKGPCLAVLGLALSAIQPFGFVLACFLLAASLAGRLLLTGKFQPGNLIWAASAGGVFLFYQLWAIQKDPVLAAWNLQNLTPSPGLGDFMISLSPAILLAVAGIIAVWKRRELPWFVLIAWLVGCSLLVYLPFNLQRRFMTGLYIPAALLGVAGVSWLGRNLGKSRRLMALILLISSLLTNLLVLASGLVGGLASTNAKPNPDIFISQSDVQAMEWLKANTPAGTVILAPARAGLFIPAWAGRRVVYGHLFETPGAAQTRQRVDAFYAANVSKPEEMALLTNVDYIYFDSGTPDKSRQDWGDFGVAVYESGGVRIVQVKR